MIIVLEPSDDGTDPIKRAAERGGFIKERLMTPKELLDEFGVDVGPGYTAQDRFNIESRAFENIHPALLDLDFPKPRNRHERRKMAKTGER